MSRSGSFNKVGLGSLILTNPSNTYTGGTIVSVGTLRLNNLSGSATGTGPITVAAGASLGGSGFAAGPVTVNANGHFSPGAASNTPGTFSAGAGLSLASGAALDFDLASTNTSGANVNDLLNISGGLTVGSSAIFNLNAYQGDVANATYKLLTYTGSLVGDVTGWQIGTTNAPSTHTYTFTSSTPGEIDLVIGFNGSTWTGSANASWDYGANWSAGSKPTSQVNVSFPSPIPATGATITLTNGEIAKTLSFADSYTLSGGTLSPGLISVAPGKTVTLATTLVSGLTKTGAGTLVLAKSNSYSGGTTINAGTLQLANASALPSITTLNIASGATLDLNGIDETFNSIAGNGAIALGAGTLTIGPAFEGVSSTLAASLSGPGNLTKAGTGTLTLTGPSTHSGFTTVANGTLRAGTANVFSPNSSFLVTSTLDLNFLSQTVGSLAGTGTVQLGGGTFIPTFTIGANNSSSTFAGFIKGSGSVAKTGTGDLIITRTNTYTGSTTINAGRLILTSSAAIPNTSSINLAGGSFVNNGSVAGNLSVQSGGVVSGSGTYSGQIGINSGGTLSPGNSPGTITSSSGSMNSGGNYHFDLRDATGSPDSGTDYWHILNQLNITASSSNPFVITPDTLNISNLPGQADNFDPNGSYHWLLAQADGGITGFSPSAFSIDSSQFQNPTNGGSFSITQSGNDLVLNFTPVPEPSTTLLVLPGAILFLARRRCSMLRRVTLSL